MFFAASQSVIMDESHVTLDETGFSEADLNVTSNDTSMYNKKTSLACYLLSRKGKENSSLNTVEMNSISDL